MIEGSDAPGETCDALITAVRVFARGKRGGAGAGPERDSPWDVKRRYGKEVLVFDTETLPGPAQRLMVGVWRLYLDKTDDEPGVTCTEEGFFYPDDMPRRDPVGYATLQAFVADPKNLADTAPGFSRRLKLWPLSRWNEERLWRCAWFHRRWSHVVGFNLPFDLGRVAPYYSAARGYYLGGWSLGFRGRFDARGKWHDKRHSRRLLMRAIDPRRTLFAWGKGSREGEEGEDEPEFWQPEAPFVDLHTLVFALTDENRDLVGACAAFGDVWDKVDVGYGKVTAKLLRYAREDVRHTATLYRNCLAELRKHPDVDLIPYALYSPATVGTEYLKAMGVRPPMEKFDLDERIYGWSMAAFFGGRAEARIVRTPVPVTLVDAASMYPTVNALLSTWRLMAGEHVDPVDRTEEVRDLISSPDVLDRAFHRDFWREEIGVTLAELSGADGDILPVRAYWDPDAQDPGIGVNPLSYRGTLWYMLPDVLASLALSGKVPEVRRAIRLIPAGVQEGLRPVRLRGDVQIDPADPGTDPFVAMVQERHRVEDNESLPEAERERLAKFLKITANSTAYGVLARFDRRERSGKLNVFGPEEEPREETVSAVETPGPFCFPPVAATLTAAARFMLALLEREVTRAGGTYAFCDTDSLAIVATIRGGRVPCPNEGGDTIRALSKRQVQEIVARFEGLNPYDETVPALWDAKHDSLNRPVTCYAISAKRYALYRETEEGVTFEHVMDGHEEAAALDEPSAPNEDTGGMAAWSEHGLGLYLDPRTPDDPERDKKERRVWMREAWEWIIREDRSAPPPEWASRPALTRFTVSSPKLARWFAGYDRSVGRGDRVRPGSFGLLAYPSGMTEELSAAARPARGYESKPEKWLQGPWYDRSDGHEIGVSALDPAKDPAGFSRALERGDVRIRTLGEVLGSYAVHPEHKSLAPGGGWVNGEERGLLRRRPISSAPVLTDLTGKEGNKLIEREMGEVTDVKEYRTDYGERANRWKFLAVPALREIQREIGAGGLADLVRVDKRTVQRALQPEDPTNPHAATKRRYLDVAVTHVRPRLRASGVTAGPDRYGTLWCASEHVASDAVKVCEVCGKPVLHPLAKYCGETCKKRAYRERRGRRVRRRRAATPSMLIQSKA